MDGSVMEAFEYTDVFKNKMTKDLILSSIPRGFRIIVWLKENSQMSCQK